MGEIKSNMAAINLGFIPTFNPVIVKELFPAVISQKPHPPPCLQDHLMYVSDKNRCMYLDTNNTAIKAGHCIESCNCKKAASRVVHPLKY